MLNDFAKLLSSLRKERKISQRKAAQALEISQALLSHYENGAREPGIAFIIRASDYYEVSVDYLLGKSGDKSIHTDTYAENAAEGGNARGSQQARMRKKIITDSTELIMDEVGKTGNKQLISAAADYLSAAVYKLSRYIYSAGSDDLSGEFQLTDQLFPELCDAEMKQCEIKLKRMMCDACCRTDASGRKIGFPEISGENLDRQHPQQYPSFAKLLTDVTERLQKNDKK